MKPEYSAQNLDFLIRFLDVLAEEDPERLIRLWNDDVRENDAQAIIAIGAGDDLDLLLSGYLPQEIFRMAAEGFSPSAPCFRLVGHQLLSESLEDALAGVASDALATHLLRGTTKADEAFWEAYEDFLA